MDGGLEVSFAIFFYTLIINKVATGARNDGMCIFLYL